MRRLWSAVLAAAMLAVNGAAGAAERHGLSKFGDLKYPADFKHFDYVNPGAPKGGRIALIGTGANTTFDSFNPFIVKGDAAQGLGLVFDSLMVRALDEPDAIYGLIASSAIVADDRLSVTFKIRPEAKFADGSPITAADCVFSFTALKEKGDPSYGVALRDVVAAQALDAHTIKYTFTGELLNDLPLIVATLPVLPRSYWASRFGDVVTEAPLGSGPYKIESFVMPRSITYVRRADYWAKDLPVNVGQYNFDIVKYEYFTERTVALENLKAGNIDLREEFTAKAWATEYDVPQVREGRIKRLVLPDQRPSGAQGFFMNLRREKFRDIRVRRAIGLAFDFEWSNKNLFFGQYTRTQSIFENSPMKASGPPGAEELALLEPFRDKLAKEVFGEPFTPPVSDGSGRDRKLLSEAGRLLAEAGYEVKGGRRVNAQGEGIDIEFLVTDEGFVRIIQPFIKNLELIGIQASIRRIDQAQYQERAKSFDFDIVTQRYALPVTPGTGLRNYLASVNADTKGSANLAGIKDPVIDALVDKVIDAKSRPELVTAARALDRVLRASHYWVPQWFKASHNIAHWDKFGRPEITPKYSDGVPETWWFDAEKAAKLGRN